MEEHTLLLFHNIQIGRPRPALKRNQRSRSRWLGQNTWMHDNPNKALSIFRDGGGSHEMMIGARDAYQVCDVTCHQNHVTLSCSSCAFTLICPYQIDRVIHGITSSSTSAKKGPTMSYKPLSGKYSDHQTFHDLLSSCRLSAVERNGCKFVRYRR